MQRYLSYAALLAERRISNIQDIQVTFGENSPRHWDASIHGDISWCSFKPVITKTQMTQDHKIQSMLRSLPDIMHLLCVHPTIDMINISNFNFVVNWTSDIEELDILDADKVLSASKHVIYILEQLHLCNALLNYIVPEMLCGFHKTGIFLIKYSSEFKSFKEYRENGQNINNFCVSPLQIILEMLSSVMEPELIEYKDFKKKMMAFWKHICMRVIGRNIDEIAQRYFSHVAGAIDYGDYIISRYCILSDDGLNIKKDKSRAYGYLGDIDLFSLAITLHQITDGKANKAMKTIIGECIRGNYLHGLSDKEIDKIEAFEIKMPQLSPIRLPESQLAPTNTKTPESPKEPELPQPPTNTKTPESPKKPESPQSPTNTQNQPQTIMLNTNPPIECELYMNGPSKKIKIQGMDRVVRSDENGDYVIWKASKVYLPKG